MYSKNNSRTNGSSTTAGTTDEEQVSRSSPKFTASHTADVEASNCPLSEHRGKSVSIPDRLDWQSRYESAPSTSSQERSISVPYDTTSLSIKSAESSISLGSKFSSSVSLPSRDPTNKLSSHSRNTKFHRVFKAIPIDERLINYYSCAYDAEILLQGTIYVSKNWFCFYSNIIGYKTKIVIPAASVASITKERTVLILPNAIRIDTAKKKYVFRSLLNRDKTYDLLVRIWYHSLGKNYDEESTGSASTRTMSPVAELHGDDDDDISHGSTEVSQTSENEIQESISSLESSLNVRDTSPPSTFFVFAVATLLLALVVSGLVLFMRLRAMDGRLSEQLPAQLYIASEMDSNSFLREIFKMKNTLHAKTTRRIEDVLSHNLHLLAQIQQSLAGLSVVMKDPSPSDVT
ncbi:PREDICTED: GRAM domain-containing protein 3-like isoform X2 [Priapulus caudatus]|uniref:GRAM domain-containing protein 3-like isoform X2 n=1 Tax=Priapulus caudatus TaxID=37621 RepID=A0ABM1DP51_PRICU|nr:PREDICTED: GRAM domain-containing protein 3-like isoform X2 [Priapulus caudatus]